MSAGQTGCEVAEGVAGPGGQRRYGLALKLAVGALVAGGAYVLGTRQNTAAQPEAPAPIAPAFVGFDRQELDLGDRRWGKDVPFEVSFANYGKESVTIAEIRSSCDCAVVSHQYEGQLVPPHGVLTIAGTFDPGIAPGPVSGTITAVTAEGRVSEVALRVNVTATFTLQPPTLDFGIVREPATQTVRFESAGAYLLEDPIADSEWVAIDTTYDNDGADICVTVDPERMLPGANWSRVVLTTDDVHVSQYALVVRATLARR